MQTLLHSVTAIAVTRDNAMLQQYSEEQIQQRKQCGCWQRLWLHSYFYTVRIPFTKLWK